MYVLSIEKTILFQQVWGTDGLVGGVGCAHIANDCTTHLSECVHMHVQYCHTIAGYWQNSV